MARILAFQDDIYSDVTRDIAMARKIGINDPAFNKIIKHAKQYKGKGYADDDVAEE